MSESVPAPSESTQAADALDTAQELLMRSEAAHAAGEHGDGLALAERANEIALRHADPRLAAESYQWIAAHHWRLGHFEPSVVAAREGARRWQAIGGPRECDTL
ncbi:MAG TPA: hypothetical protein VKI18_15620, partial [Albitalea sp.]|nr:hypothetical protein [Albitalea sp.]